MPNLEVKGCNYRTRRPPIHPDNLCVGFALVLTRAKQSCEIFIREDEYVYVVIKVA